MTTYELNAEEADLYDSDDAHDTERFFAAMRAKFGERDDPAGAVEVVHPDGFVVGRWVGQ